MDKYIILGATGGLGGNFINYLLNKKGRGLPAKNIIALGNRHHGALDPRYVTTIQCDLMKPAHCFVELDKYINENDHLHFVHFAGITINETFKNISYETLHTQYQVNVVGVLELIQRYWEYMQKTKFGRIVLIGSVLAHYPVFGTLGYSMTKAALEVVARNLTIEGKKYNILTTCIASGYVDRGIINKVPQKLQDQLKNDLIPLNRFGTTDELSKLILHLLENDYLAGQTINWNGGLYFG